MAGCPHDNKSTLAWACLRCVKGANAVRELVEFCRRISPNAIVEVSKVVEALDTGRMPDMTSPINTRDRPPSTGEPVKTA